VLKQQPKPVASLSLDLDNKWSYMKTHGDEGWESFPSYLDLVVPRFLSLLQELDLRITVFMVGQDAALSENHQAIQSIANAGHEIGNHSFSHEPWFHLYSPEKTEREVAQAEEHLQRVTGMRTIGFRGPGYSHTPALMECLARRGYLYDASTLPTFIGPLARAYYFAVSRLKGSELKQRSALFGKFRDGFATLKVHPVPCRSGSLVEIPVTTMPILRAPIHLSYIHYLASYSPALALAYFRFAIRLCRLRGITPSLLLHPLDFLDVTEVPELAFFPAMSLSSRTKLAIARSALRFFSNNFSVGPLREHARQCAGFALQGRETSERHVTASAE
jgi:peptidoglycan/xylan/chitin deacetylase (PgdA/CDA1 family)